MKKVLLLTIVILSLMTKTSLAPEAKSIPVFYSAGIMKIYPLEHAIITIESRYKVHAFNPITCAAGIMQITVIMIDAVNKVSDEQFVIADCFSVEKSLKIFRTIMTHNKIDYKKKHYHINELEKIAKIWFGRGVQKHNNWTYKEYSQKLLSLL